MNHIYVAGASNPNTAGIVPSDPNRGAVYYSDPTPSILWAWSPNARTWNAFGYVLQQVYNGDGSPTLTPANSYMPAIYTDNITKIVYSFNPTTATWS